MSGENSNSDRESSLGDCWSFVEDSKLCKCGVPLGRWTSWTEKNPGRRFRRCQKGKDKTKKCNCWEWIDPELSDYYKKLMWDLKEKLKKWESSEEFERRMGRRALKLMEMEHEMQGLMSKNVDLEEDCGNLKMMNLLLDNEKENLKKKIEMMKRKQAHLLESVSKGKSREQVQFLVIVSLVIVIVALLISVKKGPITLLKLPM